ncbi:MAG: putative tricarboxylic transport rane protein [Clostridiales bacterium]|nr:putative tricarboxylic transport rane protein [Clostridiales bacterium]MDK2934143.1 putative tricarboxylic transport rane protein [Clostridiales bacterium]
MIHGITLGPLLFTTDGNLVYAVFFAALIVANIFMLLTEFVGIRFFVKLLTVPKHLLLLILQKLLQIKSDFMKNFKDSENILGCIIMDFVKN